MASELWMHQVLLNVYTWLFYDEIIIDCYKKNAFIGFIQFEPKSFTNIFRLNIGLKRIKNQPIARWTCDTKGVVQTVL